MGKIFKYLLIVLGIIFLDQFEISGLRICDHVGNFLKSDALQSKITWIQKTAGQQFQMMKNFKANTASDEISNDDRLSLSGLLKATKTKH